MGFEGFVIHHTACSKEGEEKWDFTVCKDSSVKASSMLKHPEYIHICLEGDFNREYDILTPGQKEQLFTASKIIVEMSRLYSISPLFLFPHADSCPGIHFPWNALVIYPVDGYH